MTKQRVQDLAPRRSPALRDWIAGNLAEQAQRQRDIRAAMEALAPARNVWVAEFLQRLQRRGFNEDCDQRRRIGRDELPRQGRRRLRVVF